MREGEGRNNAFNGAKGGTLYHGASEIACTYQIKGPPEDGPSLIDGSNLHMAHRLGEPSLRSSGAALQLVSQQV
jgi:hypothetical protein